MDQNGLIFNEKIHNNVHDYLKAIYLELYAIPKYKNILYDIKKNIPVLSICNRTDAANYSKIIVCDQHVVIFGRYDDQYPVFGTYGLNACICLIFYLPKYKIGSMAHIDGLPGYSKESAIADGLNIHFDPALENIKLIVYYLETICGTKNGLEIDFYLIGGIFNLSEIMINDILLAINKLNGKKHKFFFCGRNLLGPENQARNICFNLESGQITHFDFLDNIELLKDSDTMMPKASRKYDSFLDITYLPKKNIYPK